MKITRLAILLATLAAPFCGSALADTVSPATPAKTAKPLEAQAVFGPYIGTWKGETTILNANKEPLSTLSVEQRYWWGKTAQGATELVGEATYSAKGKEGKTVSVMVKSRTGIWDGKIRATLTQGEKNEQFDGFLDEDGFLVFSPAGTKEGTTPDKISSSRVEQEKDGTVIRLRGFEKISLPSSSGEKKAVTLLLDGRLVKQPETVR